MSRRYKTAFIVLLFACVFIGVIFFIKNTQHTNERVFVDPYGFTFSYPSDWMVTSSPENLASKGEAFQLSNFPNPHSSIPTPGTTENVINGVVEFTTLSEILNNINDCHGDCNVNIIATSTIIAGREAVFIQNKNHPDAPISSFYISVATPSFPKAVLSIGIAGNPANFHQLREILDSLEAR